LSIFHARVIQFAVVLLSVWVSGCSDPHRLAGVPGDPNAAEVLSAHWAALQRGDWKTAYDCLHSELRSTKCNLKQFIAFHSRRRKTGGFPRDIKIVGSEQVGDDVEVAFDVLHVPPEGGVPVAVSPRRKVNLRRSGATWGLLTTDLLAVGPWSLGANP
jgi:hypothetical protein